MWSSLGDHVLVDGPAVLAFILSAGPLLYPYMDSFILPATMDLVPATTLATDVPINIAWTLLPAVNATFSANLVAANFFPPQHKPPSCLSLRLPAARAKDRIEGSVLSQQPQTWLAE